MIETTTLENPVSEKIHELLLQPLKDFFFVGGMPHAVKKFIKAISYLEAQRIQASIIDFYQVFYLDRGLLQYSLEVDSRVILQDLVDAHRGVLAKQFGAQELLAYVDPYLDRHLFFWEKEQKGSSAEVDFLFNLAGNVVPIEVKAGKTGKRRLFTNFWL